MSSSWLQNVQKFLSIDQSTDLECRTSTPNGASRAKKVPRQQCAFRTPPKNIAAIDFGTKNCSLAYITEYDKLELTQGVPKLPLNGMFLRVPTAILLNLSGEIEMFGHDARTVYGNLEDSERESYFYFEEIKMNLHRDQKVNREMKVKALNGKEFYLVDVIAQILKYLKQEFLVSHLQRGGYTFSTTDFDWVITVPAIWKARGKQMMREAGYKAGLCSGISCGNLEVVSRACMPACQPSEKSPHKLSLALEPESAAIYCHEALKRRLVAPYCQLPESGPTDVTSTPKMYLIVDIGAGTVDLSAHRIVCSPETYVEELHPPIGNDWGGSKVNQEFAKFLENLVSDAEFSRYIGTCDPEINLRNQFELNQLVNVDFEKQKLIFGRIEREKRREAVVRLPTSMLETYDDIEERIKDFDRTEVRLVRHNLRLSPAKMEQFFQPAVKSILECISDLMEKVGSVDVLYLVGGFGGSPYVYQQVLTKFGQSCKCVVPLNPEFAVVEGAALFRSNPGIIRARKADATYGKQVVRPFDRKKHDPSHMHVDDDGVPQCYDLFQTIVEIGDKISPEYLYMLTSSPVTHNQRNMHVEIYSSLERADAVWYTEGEKSGDAVKIGELTIDMPVLSGDKKRQVDFLFDFSHTEIQVEAYDRTSGKAVKAVMDLLSAL